MIPATASWRFVRLGAPRVSGDDPEQAQEILKIAECSPRERG